MRATAYGRPATDLLALEIAESKGGDPLAPVTVVVPSNYSGISTRRSLAGRPGGLANVSFTTLFRLAERLGAPRLAARGRRPSSLPVVAQAVRETLATDPGVFEPVAGHPATEIALVESTRELAGLTTEALDALSRCGRRARDVVRIARKVRTQLSTSWYDEHDLLGAATDSLLDGATTGPVIVHLLQEISPAAADFLRALGNDRSLVVNVALTGVEAADRSVVEAHRRAGLFVDSTSIERRAATAIVSVSDPDEEVRDAVRTITGWMRDGILLGRVGLLYGSHDPYARLVHEHLDAAAIPHHGAPVREIGRMLLGRTVRSLLALPDRAFRRSDVLAVLTSAPIRLPGDRLVLAPARAWERVSREAGVVDSDDWDHRLGLFAADQRRRAKQADREGRERLGTTFRSDATEAERLQQFVSTLASDLRAVGEQSSWAAMVRAMHLLVRKYLGDEESRVQWPEEEQQAAERVEQVLDRMSSLDEVVGPAPTLEIFRRTLEAELETSLRRAGHFGSGILVGPVSISIGIELDRVVILGLAEGSFPPHRLEDSLLADHERRAAAGELHLRSNLIGHDHRHLLAAVAAAKEATLYFPRGDLRRHGDRVASRWLLADAEILAGQGPIFTEDLNHLAATWLRHVPSFAGGLARLGFPGTSQEMRLAAMLRDRTREFADDEVLTLGDEVVRARKSTGFTRFDGNLEGLPLPDYTAGDPTSTTRLQAWAKCPHAFLLEYLLGVEVVQETERQLEMSPIDKGSLIHEILDRFVAEQIRAGRAGPWMDKESDRLMEIAEQVFEEYGGRGVTGRALFWRRDRARILADLGAFARVDEGRPAHTELSFDDVFFPISGDRSVRFRGVIDRVDITGASAARVSDYKTGSPTSYEGLSPADPHQRGARLQLAVYGLAVQQKLARQEVDAEYWFVTGKARFKRIGYPLTPLVIEEVGGAVGVIVDGIAAGAFPARPPATPAFAWVDCWYCSPDGLSTADARRDWERKRSDPVLSSYLHLVEPEAEPAEASDEES